MKNHWTQRHRNWWTIKIVVACCVALFFFSPTFSRKPPTDSNSHLGGRDFALERQVEARSEVRGRMLEEMEGDLTNDYSTPTHNHNGDEGIPNPPAKKGTVRGTMRMSQDRLPREFARYTSKYGHRHLRGV